MVRQLRGILLLRRGGHRDLEKQKGQPHREDSTGRSGMRDPCNGNHARSRSPVPELSSDIIAERRYVLAQGIQFADLERKICESATDAFHVDSVVSRINRRECFVGYHPEIHRRTENPLRGPIHPTAKAKAVGLLVPSTGAWAARN